MAHTTRVAALSDIGCKRSNNEDAFGYNEAAGIYIVSDGMGGRAAGEVASQTTVAETIRTFLQLQQSHGVTMPAQDILYHSVLHANTAVHSLAQSNPELRGMGATLVAACVQGLAVVIANIGDSRAYLLRSGLCSQITHDHSYVAEQVRSGFLHPSDAASHPHSTMITRALGIAAEVEPDLFAANLLPGDTLLLATDGLMRHVADPEIAHLVSAAPSIEQACEALIQAAKHRGAEDNVSCLLLQML